MHEADLLVRWQPLCPIPRMRATKCFSSPSLPHSSLSPSIQHEKTRWRKDNKKQMPTGFFDDML